MSYILTLYFFPFMIAFAGASDLITMKISNKISIIIVILFFTIASFLNFSLEEIIYHIACGLLILSITFCMFALGWIGGGDAKLAAAISLWFGFGTILIDYFIISTILGGLLTIFIIKSRNVPLPRVLAKQPWAVRLHDVNTGIPYGLALAAAGLIIYPQSRIWTVAFQG